MTDDYIYDYHTHHEIIKPKSIYTKKGLCGLINLGNKCFLNSIIQCLSNTVKLTDYLISYSHIKDNTDINIHSKKEHDFVNQFVILLENIWKSNKLIKPKSLIDSLSKLIPKYQGIQQQDSHECLVYMLDLLHKGISYEIDVEIQGEVKTKTDKLMKQHIETWKSFYENNYSFIIENFNGMYYNKITCQNCSNQENIFEPYNILSIDIPTNESVSVENCINNTLNKDELINTWTCDKCKKNGCKKNTSIWNLPNYLIIHLKRFKNNGQKNNQHISFTLNDINISNIIADDKQDPNNYIYSLYAINYHSGSLSSGHYWSCCKNLDSNWYLFNDGHVSKCHDTSEFLSKDAYILFYYRKYIPQN